MSDTERVRAAYDHRPWPEPGTVLGPALPEAWVNAVGPRPVLGPGARVLVAGCGTGGEVASFAERYPTARVLGVDLSERSIAAAREAWPHLGFEVVDLGNGELERGKFDFISCHAVADYVPDGPSLLANLAGSLDEGGVLYVGTNTERHPGARIRSAMGRMGLPSEAWQEGPVARAGLRAIAGLAGDGFALPDLASHPEARLAADVFPPFCHATDLATWHGWAEQAGLTLVGSLAALWALPRVGDSDLPLLYGLGRAGLAELVEELQANPVLQLLFVKGRVATPPWQDLDALWSWRATLEPSLGAGHWPELRGDWMATRTLTVGTPGLPDLHLTLSAWMLELYRRCDGRPLAEIRAEMPVPAHDEHLRASLYRFWQAGLVRLSA